MGANAAWVRFFRTLGAAANQLAADLTQVSQRTEPDALAVEARPESLVIGERQKAIAALPGLRQDEGMKTAEVAQAIGYSDVPNVYTTMRTLEKRGLVELVPNREPQRWRLVARYRERANDRGGTVRDRS
jgi:hypothetical protein